jgi:hypothetical protein
VLSLFKPGARGCRLLAQPGDFVFGLQDAPDREERHALVRHARDVLDGHDVRRE